MLVRVTDAPGITELVLSVTRPTTVARDSWAHAAQVTVRIASIDPDHIILGVDILPPHSPMIIVSCQPAALVVPPTHLKTPLCPTRPRYASRLRARLKLVSPTGPRCVQVPATPRRS